MTVPANGSTARTGRDADVAVGSTLVARCTQWSLDESAAESAWGDSNSEGYTNRSLGRKDATGNIQGKLDEDVPCYDLFAPGDIVEITLWEDDETYYYFGRAFIRTFNVLYNIDTREVVGWTATFASDGKYYRPGEAGIPSKTKPAAP